MGHRRRSKLRVLGVRLCTSIVLGLVAGVIMTLAFLSSVHPPDRWYSLRVYETVGAVSGAIVGIAWGIGALFGDATASVKPPAPDPDAKSESDWPDAA